MTTVRELGQRLLAMRVRPERFLAMAGGLAGVVMVFLTPPLQAPDEVLHLQRAYCISEGHLGGQVFDRRIGGEVPTSIAILWGPFGNLPFKPEQRIVPGSFERALQIPLDPATRQFVDIPAAGHVPPLVHLPQAAGIALARLMNQPPLMMLYAGRLMNLLVWLVLVTTAVHLAPSGKWILTALALTPMSIAQAASMSYDAQAIGLSLLAVATMLRWALDPSSDMTWRRALLGGLLFGVLGLAKLAYVPLTALLFCAFLRPPRTTRLWAKLVSAFLIAAGPITAWLLLAPPYIVYERYNPIYRTYLPLFPFANPPEQCVWMLTHPVDFAVRCWHTVADAKLWHGCIANLGWLDTPFPAWFAIAYGVLLAGLLFASADASPPVRLAWWQRCLFAGAAVACVFAVCFLINAQTTPVEAGPVKGVQGRYFLPVLPALAFALHWPSRNRGIDVLTRAAPLLLTANLCFTFWILLTRYYLP